MLKIIGSIYLMKNTENTSATTTTKDIALGNVYVMTHSLFSDVVKIGCTTEEPEEYAKALSAKTIGEYSVAFSLQCNNPCKVKKQIKKYLDAQEYVNEFYQVSPDVAKKPVSYTHLTLPTTPYV